jgi:hypothetical protein
MVFTSKQKIHLTFVMVFSITKNGHTALLPNLNWHMQAEYFRAFRAFVEIRPESQSLL